MKSIKKMKGAVLIMALLIMFIIASLSTMMLVRESHSIRRSSAFFNSDDAMNLSLGLVDWATTSLAYQASQGQPDRLLLIGKKEHISGAVLQGVVTDAQSRFNVNNVIDPFYEAAFARLIKNVMPDVIDSPKIAHEVKSFISEFQMGSGIFDEKYCDMPYYPFHRPFVQLSSLMLVKGVTPELFAVLKPYLVALPRVTPVNINTASPALLKAVLPCLSDDALNTLIRERASASLTSVNKFISASNCTLQSINKLNYLTVKSNYFLLASSVQLDQYTLNQTALLERDTTGKKPAVEVLWQHRN